MRKVLTFWQLPDEERRFIERVSELEPTVALPAVRTANRSELFAMPLREYLTAMSPPACFILPERFAGSIEIDATTFSQGVMYGISAMQQPVLGYDRGLLADGRLPLSNIYAYVTRLHQGSESPKGSQFTAWCNKVLGIARRHASEKFRSYRATKAAVEAESAGTVELVDY